MVNNHWQVGKRELLVKSWFIPQAASYEKRT